ncbi:MAG: signal peptidase I [Alphaproteobacteria bacterium]|nr:signal peptidase I [Alphaproteobacteria bacterium]
MSKHKPESFIYHVWDFIKTIVIALAIAFVIRSFWFEPFRIPSSSMVPTLQVGDFLFVNKYTYGLKVPFTDETYFEKAPKRGDIVVFKRVAPELPGSFFGLGPTFFIKRIVAVPGDKIAYEGKFLRINGEIAPLEFIEQQTYEDRGDYSYKVNLYREDLGRVKHDVYLTPMVEEKNLREATVPEGRYVVMGDNRDNSHDSRGWVHPNWGFLERDDIIGRASFTWLSLGKNYMPRLERMFINLKVKDNES